MGKRALSAIVAAAMLAATALPALGQTYLPQAPQIREMPGSRWQGGGQRTYLPQAPQIGGGYGGRYRDGYYRHPRRGGGDGLGAVLGILGGLALLDAMTNQATPQYGYMPYNYYAPPRRCYTGPEWVWHGYQRGWVWQNVTRC